jgi:hypothetical protein
LELWIFRYNFFKVRIHFEIERKIEKGIYNFKWLLAETELGTCAQRAFGLPRPGHRAEQAWGSAARNRPGLTHGQCPRAQDLHVVWRLGRGAH